MELAAAFDAAKSGGVIVAAIAAVFTIGYVANRLGEDEDWLSLALVVGGSMGAQQTYEWAVRYSDVVRRAALIAGTARNTIHDFLFTETLIEAITSDPVSTRVSMHRRQTYEKVCCVSPKSGQ